MIALILIVACVVSLDCLLFQGKWVSLLYKCCRKILYSPQPRHGAPSNLPAPSLCPDSLLVRKSYTTGPIRHGAAKTTEPEESEEEDTIFVPSGNSEPAMKMWSGLIVQPSIDADGELMEPEAPDASAALPQTSMQHNDAAYRDKEIHAMLGELDAGESLMSSDATAEEQQAIANFDIRAYV